MTTYDWLSIFRGIERLMIEAGGITSILLGVLLYRWGVQGTQGIEGKAPGIEFKLSNAAPGSVLALYGMVVLVVGLSSPLKLTDEPGDTESANDQPAQSEPPDAGSSKTPPFPGRGRSTATYSALTDRAKNALDGLIRAGDAEPDRAQMSLASQQDTARGLADDENLPVPLRTLFEHTRDAEPTPSWQLRVLADYARLVEGELERQPADR